MITLVKPTVFTRQPVAKPHDTRFSAASKNSTVLPSHVDRRFLIERDLSELLSVLTTSSRNKKLTWKKDPSAPVVKHHAVYTSTPFTVPHGQTKALIRPQLAINTSGNLAQHTLTLYTTDPLQGGCGWMIRQVILTETAGKKRLKFTNIKEVIDPAKLVLRQQWCIADGLHVSEREMSQADPAFKALLRIFRPLVAAIKNP